MSSRKKLCTGLNLWKSIHCAKTEKAHGFNISNKLQSFTVNNTKRRFQNITHASHREQQKSTLESKSLRIINEPTIYALSTPPGRAAIAIIRISGQACMTVSRVVTDSGKPPPKPRYATLRTLYNPDNSSPGAQILDPHALLLYFPGPQTVTGEDVLELHIHGGPAVVKAVLNAIPNSIPLGHRKAGLIRYAEQGEFTKRAFYNNRLDLTQVEALSDTLSAETEQQRQLAVRGATNQLAKEYESWRQDLLYARGELEALIDFSEDQDFDESAEKLLSSVVKQIRDLKSQLMISIKNSFRGELLRNGISIALLGAPNAGKSSLLNAIVGREAAIVSKEEGTTRDVVDVGVDIGGFYCKISDLAGLRKISQHWRDSDVGDVEKEGMKRAKDCVLKANVVIVVLPADDLRMNSGVEETYTLCNRETQRSIVVVSKSDLLEKDKTESKDIRSVLREKGDAHVASSKSPMFMVSCKQAQNPATDLNTNQLDPGGIQVLLDGLKEVFRELTSAAVVEGHDGLVDASIWEPSLGVSERQRLLLQQCLQSLDLFLTETESVNPHQACDVGEADITVVAEHLRAAADCLAKITGKGDCGDVEDVLGIVFEKQV